MDEAGENTVFGSLIIGTGIGLVAMIAVVATGAGLLSAFLTYWLAGCAGTLGICIVKTLRCKADAAR